MFRTIRATFTHRFAATTIAAALLLPLAAIGCGSSSDTPADSGSTTCDLAGVQALFSAKSCTVSGCHASTQPAAGLDLMSAGLADRLLDKSPVAGVGLQPSMCVGANRNYLNGGSDPATGLLLDKVGTTPPCGARMPSGLPPLNNSQMACLRSWALTVTKP
jgi:hypothetical protein